MKVVYAIAAGISIVMILCTLICGLWIKTHPDPSSTQFHGNLAIATVIISLITLVLGFFK